MKTIIGLVLILGGIALFVAGLNRKDSLAGQAASATTQVANAVDGGVRTTRHMTYMIGGGVLAVVGIAVMASGRRGPRPTSAP